MEYEEAGVNLESVIMEENDYFGLFDELHWPARRQEDLYYELIKTLDGWQRTHSKTFIKKTSYPATT